jgi:hypothetical protein
VRSIDCNNTKIIELNKLKNRQYNTIQYKLYKLYITKYIPDIPGSSKPSLQSQKLSLICERESFLFESQRSDFVYFSESIHMSEKSKAHSQEKKYQMVPRREEASHNRRRE